MNRLGLAAASAALALLPVALVSAPSGAVTHQDNPGKAKGHDKDNPGKAKGHDKDNPGKAKGHDKDNPGKAKGKTTAPGQVKRTAAPAPTAPANDQSNKDKSKNENKKVTFCHVPPGNPDNGHLITTSVNAITPGHTNHPGDIIPPFSFVKHGRTVTFDGQNWDAEGRATLENGCRTPDAATSTQTGTVESSTQTAATTDQAVKASSEVAGEDDESLVDQVLPQTGGARLAVLLGGLALLAAGIYLVRRRPAV